MLHFKQPKNPTHPKNLNHGKEKWSVFILVSKDKVEFLIPHEIQPLLEEFKKLIPKEHYGPPFFQDISISLNVSHTTLPYFRQYNMSPAEHKE